MFFSSASVFFVWSNSVGKVKMTAKYYLAYIAALQQLQGIPLGLLWI